MFRFTREETFSRLFFLQLQKLETALFCHQQLRLSVSPNFRSLDFWAKTQQTSRDVNVVSAKQHKDQCNFFTSVNFLHFPLLIIFNCSKTHETVKLEGQILPWFITGIIPVTNLAALSNPGGSGKRLDGLYPTLLNMKNQKAQSSHHLGVFNWAIPETLQTWATRRAAARQGGSQNPKRLNASMVSHVLWKQPEEIRNAVLCTISQHSAPYDLVIHFTSGSFPLWTQGVSASVT